MLLSGRHDRDVPREGATALRLSSEGGRAHYCRMFDPCVVADGIVSHEPEVRVF
ncbi:MAG: hypothetical protein WBF34_36750 [Streptosporangiaceae bacterium]